MEPSNGLLVGISIANGNIHPNLQTVQLSLKCTDYEHVVKYKRALSSTYHLALYTNSDTACKASHNICSRLIAQDLMSLGCIPNKSLILEWPHLLPREYGHHFVRGYFDGDGCIRYNASNKGFVVSFAGSKLFIPRLQQYIKMNVLLDVKHKGSIRNVHQSKQLDYSGNQLPLKVLDWLYEDIDDCIRLNRKHLFYKKIHD